MPKHIRKKHPAFPRRYGPTLAFRVLWVLTAVSAALTFLSWRLMHYLPNLAGMEVLAATGTPPAATVLVSQSAFAIFAGLCTLTLLCVLVWLVVWLRKL